MGNDDKQIGDNSTFDRAQHAINRGIYKASVYSTQSSQPSQTANTPIVDYSRDPDLSAGPATSGQRAGYFLGAILCFAITIFIWNVAPWTFIWFWIIPLAGLFYVGLAFSG